MKKENCIAQIELNTNVWLFIPIRILLSMTLDRVFKVFVKNEMLHLRLRVGRVRMLGFWNFEKVRMLENSSEKYHCNFLNIKENQFLIMKIHNSNECDEMPFT